MSNHRKSLEPIERESKSTGNIDQAVVVASERYGLSLLLDKVHRREMKGVECSNGLGERLQSTCQYRRGGLYESDTSQQRPRFASMRSGDLPCLNPRPNFVFNQPAGDEGCCPKCFGRDAVVRQHLRERYRRVELDQRSLRSCSSSRFRSRKDIAGLRGGAPLAGSSGGVIQPRRTASANIASAITGLRLASGGTISATTRSRSVTRMVSHG